MKVSLLKISRYKVVLWQTGHEHAGTLYILYEVSPPPPPPPNTFLRHMGAQDCSLCRRLHA